MVNVPPYVQAEHLAFGFSAAGEVSHVIIGDTKGRRLSLPHPNDPVSRHFNALPTLNTFKTAFVVFRSAKSLRNAVQHLTEVCLYENNRTILKTGVDKWTEEYLDRVPIASELSEHVEEYMRLFDEVEVERKQAAREPEVDDDGWQVVKKGRGAGFEQKESTLKRLENKIEDGKKKKELANFYTFQLRESKQQHIVGLRKRFEDDKRKIELMKKNRRFKPF